MQSAHAPAKAQPLLPTPCGGGVWGASGPACPLPPDRPPPTTCPLLAGDAPHLLPRASYWLEPVLWLPNHDIMMGEAVLASILP